MLPDRPTPEETEKRFRELLAGQGMPQPDEVRHDLEVNELVFLWHERQVAIIVELSEDGPLDVRAGVPMPPV